MNLQRLSALANELNRALAVASFNPSKRPHLLDTLRRLRDEIDAALAERKEAA